MRESVRLATAIAVIAVLSVMLGIAMWALLSTVPAHPTIETIPGVDYHECVYVREAKGVDPTIDLGKYCKVPS